MALGEWVSVTSARELAQREIRIETGELTEDPGGRRRRAEADLRGQGVEPERGRDNGQTTCSPIESTAIEHLAREELGIDPKAAGRLRLGSGGHLVRPLRDRRSWCRSCRSVVLRAGASPWPSASPSARLGLFGIGAAITLFTGAPVWRSGGRQLLLGLAAAGVTFGVGRS